MGVRVLPGSGWRVGRWLIIRPVNAVLGWLFRGFNRGFDAMTHVYGWRGQAAAPQPGRAAGLRRPARADLLDLSEGPYRLHSATGPGPADREHPIARFGVAGADQGAVAQDRGIAHETPGVRAHGRDLRHLVHARRPTAPISASMFIVLDPFDERQTPELARHGDHGPAAQGTGRDEVKEAKVTVYGASPIPGLGVAGGFKFIVEDRGGLGLGDLQEQTDNLVASSRPARASPAWPPSSAQHAAALPGHRPGQGRQRWASRSMT